MGRAQAHPRTAREVPAFLECVRARAALLQQRLDLACSSLGHDGYEMSSLGSGVQSGSWNWPTLHLLNSPEGWHLARAGSGIHPAAHLHHSPRHSLPKGHRFSQVFAADATDWEASGFSDANVFQWQCWWAC